MPQEPSPNQLVPFRWPSGWTAANLSLLAGGPINCLLLDTPTHPVAEPARGAGLVVREWSSLGAAPLAQVRWDGSAPIVALSEVAWPQIKPVVRGANVDSGPTGAPWIDSTSWVSRLAASRAPTKQVWLAFDPPRDLILDAAAYRLAIADCAATGARWTISLDPKLAAGLAAGNAQALATWRQMNNTLAFFEKRVAWRSYRAQGPLGVISTFSGANEFMATEVLNLAARRNLLYRVIDRTVAESDDLAGLRAVLWVDPQTPPAPLAAKLSAFARGGGLLVLPRAAAAAFKGERTLDCAVSGYEMRALGKGAVAAALRDWDDPYFVALDTHSLVSRRYDPVRMFNASSLWVHYSAQPRGTASLIQLVSFASRPGTAVSLRIQYPHREVRMQTLESGAPKLLEQVRVGRDIEYYLPAFSTYAALEVTA
jgi:transposase